MLFTNPPNGPITYPNPRFQLFILCALPGFVLIIGSKILHHRILQERKYEYHDSNFLVDEDRKGTGKIETIL